MMKMMILAPRKAGLSHQEFRDYVTRVHGPLVKSVPEVAGAIHHYHYNFPLAGRTDEAFGHPIAAHLDVVTEAWFDSRAAQIANMSGARYLAEVRPDEGRFADEGRAVMHYTHEIEITPGASTGGKLFYFRRRCAGLGREEFQSKWRHGFTEIVGDSPIWRSVVSRYVQNHVFPEADHPSGDDPRFFDVIDELFLPEAGAEAALRRDQRMVSRIAALEHQLLDKARTCAIVTETVRNIE